MFFAFLDSLKESFFYSFKIIDQKIKMCENFRKFLLFYFSVVFFDGN